ncbi:MAG: hypothetical protein IPM60_14720, partial [Rhodospirillales bacterium]|nr:hypothetical protein [Rhodospirillales bacterium]
TLGGKYDIELHRIDTPTKVLLWIHHLSGKVWPTTAHFRRMITLLGHGPDSKGGL